MSKGAVYNEKRRISKLKKYSSCILVLLILSSLFIEYGSTEFKGESDWEGHRRKIRYEFDTSVTEQWKTWIKEAIKNWNDVKDETGWEFVEAKEDEDADLVFKLRDIPASEDCGGACVSNGFGEDVIKKLTIEIDCDILDETWSDGTKPEGGQKGWGKTGEKTHDPVLVIMHELTHVMRLDHSGGSDTGNLEDPLTPGNHDNPKDRKPSENDKNEAKKAADDKTVKKENKKIGANGESFSYDGTTLIVPPDTLVDTYTFGIRPLTKTRTPQPTQLEDISPCVNRGVIIYATDITSDFPGELSGPITVKMQYSDSDIAGGYILGLRHSAVSPRIQEDSLRAYRYDSTAEIWVPVLSTLDMENNTVTFNTATLNVYYGVGGLALLAEGDSSACQPIEEPILTGVYSTFDLHHDIVEMYIRVVSEDYSTLVYDIEILRKDQETMWDKVEVLEAPEGWAFEDSSGCGARFYTETNPLVKCQRVKFTFRVWAPRVSWYIWVHLFDIDHETMGMIVSTRGWLHYPNLV